MPAFTASQALVGSSVAPTRHHARSLQQASRPAARPARGLRMVPQAAMAAKLDRLMDSTPFDAWTFAPIRESQISRAMTSRYFQDLHEYAECDVIIVGAGSAGACCPFDCLARTRCVLRFRASTQQTAV